MSAVPSTVSWFRRPVRTAAKLDAARSRWRPEGERKEMTAELRTAKVLPDKAKNTPNVDAAGSPN
jgi:hypothetical protein